VDLLERAWGIAVGTSTAGGSLRLPAEAIGELKNESGSSIERLMLAIIPLAARFSQPRLSGFRVGAVAQGTSGTLYLGANFEIDCTSLSQTVHAEQAAVVAAALAGEAGVERLAVSAPPCGHCRQFLYELSTADRLQILLADKPATPLAQLLPSAFGPADLCVRAGLLGSPAIAFLSGTASGPAAEAARAAAALSYAPYTGAIAGAGLLVRPPRGGSEQAVGGPYLENAAFNPSLSPLQSALIGMLTSVRADFPITAAALVQLPDSKIDHAPAARALLARVAPHVTLETFPLRRA
jgi:cytidine deaminase